MDASFRRVAPYYAYRTPYLARFFAAVAQMLGLRPTDFVLDLACGTGELAIGLARYCGTILAIDRSAEMLSHRRASPANVHFVVANIGVDPVLPSRRANHAVIGRAVTYFKSDELSPFLEASTRDTASVIVCGANIDGCTPWHGEYLNLRNRYRNREFPSDFTGAQLFANSRWSVVRHMSVKAQVQYTIDDVMNQALSYSATCEAILKDRDRFRRELDAVLTPHCSPLGQVSATIANWAIEYAPSGKAAEHTRLSVPSG